MTIKIAIAENHHLVRKGLCELINSFEGMQIMLEAENGKILLDQISPTNPPDIALIDLEMPVLNGNETIKLLRQTYPGIKIIVLTMYESNQFILHALKLGANAYLLKDDEPQILQNAIISVLENGYFFTDKTSKVMMASIAGSDKPSMPLLESLTERELEILKLICKGLSSKEIGDKIFIAERTVEGHRDHARQKLGARNTASMIIAAIRNGLIDINDC